MPDKPGLLAAYLVVGSDELKRKTTIERLKARLDEGLAAFNLDQITPNADTNPADLLASLNTLPMGDGPRVVIVDPADKLPKPVSEAIISYLADPNPGCTLLLVATALAKNTRLYKAVAKVGKQAIIDCAPQKPRDLPGFVSSSIARAHGVTIGLDAARELVSRVGESTYMLDNQVATLASLMGGSGTITVRMVEDNVARIVEVKPWPFLDALAARDARKAMELYQLLRGPKDELMGLFSLVQTRLRELLCAQCMDARGRSGSVASELGKQDWQVRDYVRWSRNFRPGELEALLSECTACERVLKGTGSNDQAFVRLIVAICGGR